ncbi:hypothetical protein BH11MYX1_BH11MYX1_12270 [soil metagenome]
MELISLHEGLTFAGTRELSHLHRHVGLYGLASTPACNDGFCQVR